MPELEVVGAPEMCNVAFKSRTKAVDVYKVPLRCVARVTPEPLCSCIGPSLDRTLDDPILLDGASMSMAIKMLSTAGHGLPSEGPSFLYHGLNPGTLTWRFPDCRSTT